MRGQDDLEVYEFCSAYTAALVGRLSDKTLSDNPIWRDSGPGGIRNTGGPSPLAESPMKISAGIAMTGSTLSSSAAIESMISFVTQKANHSGRKAGRMSPHRTPAWTMNMTLNP